MASARARMGALRRKIGKRQKKAGVASGIFSTLGTVAAFGAGQAKKAETAWGEYEAGYKELGGEGFERPKFGQKGYFKGPEGEVRIGASIYDRSKIQEAGSFLGSDAAAVLDDDARKQYLGRTAPGRDMTAEEVSTTRESLRPKMPFTEDEYDVDEEFGTLISDRPVYQPAPPKSMKPQVWQNQEPGLSTVGKDWQTPPPRPKPVSFGVQSPDYLKGYQPNLQAPGSTITDEDRYQTARIQESQRMAPRLARQRADQAAIGTTVPLPQDMSGINIASRHQQYLQRLGEGDKRMEGTGTYSFARGGDFITNGPQKILVGDNPGGRERVSITPLDSDDIKGYYGKKRSWLESLYENNRRRKVY